MRVQVVKTEISTLPSTPKNIFHFVCQSRYEANSGSVIVTNKATGGYVEGDRDSLVRINSKNSSRLVGKWKSTACRSNGKSSGIGNYRRGICNGQGHSNVYRQKILKNRITRNDRVSHRPPL